MANKHVKRCLMSLAIAAAAAKLLQSCLTLCDPIDGECKSCLCWDISTHLSAKIKK